MASAGLGALWNPSFTAEGGEAIAGANKGKVTIVPTASSVTLNVNNGGTLLGKETFRVRRVPRPEIRIVGSGGSELNDKSGENAASLRFVNAKAIADESFATTNPEDANYRVSEIEVALARGTKRVASVTLPGGGSISSLAGQAQAGDRYRIEVKGVQRKNFKGTIETIPFSFVKVIPLN